MRICKLDGLVLFPGHIVYHEPMMAERFVVTRSETKSEKDKRGEARRATKDFVIVLALLHQGGPHVGC